MNTFSYLPQPPTHSVISNTHTHTHTPILNYTTTIHLSCTYTRLWWVWLERCRDGSYAINALRCDVWVVCACIAMHVHCRLFHWFLGKCFLVEVHPYMTCFCTFLYIISIVIRSNWNQDSQNNKATLHVFYYDVYSDLYYYNYTSFLQFFFTINY